MTNLVESLMNLWTGFMFGWLICFANYYRRNWNKNKTLDYLYGESIRENDKLISKVKSLRDQLHQVGIMVSIDDAVKKEFDL